MLDFVALAAAAGADQIAEGIVTIAGDDVLAGVQHAGDVALAVSVIIRVGSPVAA